MRWVLVVALFWLVPTPGQAQDVARARALFEEGLEAARAERWVEARDAFRESLSIAERPSTLVNLAGAEVETGHLVEGAASYRRFIELATGRDARLRREAQRELTGVEARIPYATIAIDGSSPGDEVRLDGVSVSADALAAPVPVNPGSHILLVLRDGEEVARRAFDASERETAAVSLAVVAPSVDEAAPAPMDEVIVVPVDSAGGSDDGVWIGLGVGIGVVVVAAVIIGAVLATTPGAATPYQGNFGDGIVRF